MTESPNCWSISHHRSSIKITDGASVTHIRTSAVTAWGTTEEGFTAYVNCGRPLKLDFPSTEAEAQRLCAKLDNLL